MFFAKKNDRRHERLKDCVENRYLRTSVVKPEFEFDGQYGYNITTVTNTGHDEIARDSYLTSMADTKYVRNFYILTVKISLFEVQNSSIWFVKVVYKAEKKYRTILLVRVDWFKE